MTPKEKITERKEIRHEVMQKFMSQIMLGRIMCTPEELECDIEDVLENNKDIYRRAGEKIDGLLIHRYYSIQKVLTWIEMYLKCCDKLIDNDSWYLNDMPVFPELYVIQCGGEQLVQGDINPNTNSETSYRNLARIIEQDIKIYGNNYQLGFITSNYSGKYRIPISVLLSFFPVSDREDMLFNILRRCSKWTSLKDWNLLKGPDMLCDYKIKKVWTGSEEHAKADIADIERFIRDCGKFPDIAITVEAIMKLFGWYMRSFDYITDESDWIESKSLYTGIIYNMHDVMYIDTNTL